MRSIETETTLQSHTCCQQKDKSTYAIHNCVKWKSFFSILIVLRWAPLGPFCICKCRRTLNLHHQLYWSRATSNYDENLAFPLSEEFDCSFQRWGKVVRVNVKFPVEMTFICWFHHFFRHPFFLLHTQIIFFLLNVTEFSAPQNVDSTSSSQEVRGCSRWVSKGEKFSTWKKKPFCMQMFTPFYFASNKSKKGTKSADECCITQKKKRKKLFHRHFNFNFIFFTLVWWWKAFLADRGSAKASQESIWNHKKHSAKNVYVLPKKQWNNWWWWKWASTRERRAHEKFLAHHQTPLGIALMP